MMPLSSGYTIPLQQGDIVEAAYDVGSTILPFCFLGGQIPLMSFIRCAQQHRAEKCEGRLRPAGEFARPTRRPSEKGVNNEVGRFVPTCGRSNYSDRVRTVKKQADYDPKRCEHGRGRQVAKKMQLVRSR